MMRKNVKCGLRLNRCAKIDGKAKMAKIISAIKNSIIVYLGFAAAEYFGQSDVNRMFLCVAIFLKSYPISYIIIG